MPATTASHAPSAVPPRVIVEGLRDALWAADDAASELGIALRGVMPTGPFAPGSAADIRLTSATHGAAYASQWAARAQFQIDALRGYTEIPYSLQSELQSVAGTSRFMAGHAGYFRALRDTRVVPSQTDFIQARRDTFSAHIRIRKALIALRETGWEGSEPPAGRA
jgi:hypothetical protein